MTIIDVLVAVGIGLAAGAFAGLFGVGGGVIIVPALVFLLDVDQHVAQGTSLMVIVPTAVVATLANARRGNIERLPVLLLAAGGALGAMGGALISVRLDEAALRKIFGAFLLVMSVRLLLHREPAELVPPE